MTHTLNLWFTTQSWFAIGLSLLAVSAALTTFGLLSGFVAERIAFARGLKIYDVKLRPGQIAHEALGTALFHAVFVPIATVVFARGWVRFSDGWLATVLSFALGWYGFQFCYYWAHRAMHLRKLRWIHHWHHRSHVTTPMTGLSMHPVEAVLWSFLLLWPPVLLSSIGLLSIRGWGFFLAVFWIGNIAGHANAEIMGIRVTKLTSILQSNPVSYHSLHHARYDKHYGFATAIMDRLFGTEWDDWEAVHDRAMTHKPLRSLAEHVPAKSEAATSKS